MLLIICFKKLRFANFLYHQLFVGKLFGRRIFVWCNNLSSISCLHWFFFSFLEKFWYFWEKRSLFERELWSVGSVGWIVSGLHAMTGDYLWIELEYFVVFVFLFFFFCGCWVMVLEGLKHLWVIVGIFDSSKVSSYRKGVYCRKKFFFFIYLFFFFISEFYSRWVGWI